MRFKEVLRWVADNGCETTPAVVVVSECGTVVKRLSYRRWNKHNNNYSNIKERIYKQSSNRGKQRFDPPEKILKYGVYKHVEINGKTFSVHRLVAKAFLPNRDNKPCVNHINGVRDDNRAKNLEWVTNKENVAHAWTNGLRTRNKMLKVTDSDVAEMIVLRKQGLSNVAIGKIFKVSHETVRTRIKVYETRNDG